MPINDLAKNINNFPRIIKQLLFFIVDFSLCIFCTWLAFYLRLEYFLQDKEAIVIVSLISIILALPLFWIFGLYRNIIRFSGLSIIFSIASSISFYTLIFFLIVGIYQLSEVPRSIGVIQPILLFITISSSRLIVKFLIYGNSYVESSYNKKQVLIYGAGSAGRQIMYSLENNNEYKVVGFIDDDNKLHDQVLLGRTIYSPSKLDYLIKVKNVSTILLSIPSINRKRRNEIIRGLNKFKLLVKTLPSINDIVDGKVSVSNIKELEIDDLLNRDQIKAYPELLNKNIQFKTVAVTGAGGSIGSELCRQIIKINPKILILLELNEYALYKIYNEIENIDKKIKIIPILANIQDEDKINEIFSIFKVDTVYHSAAYKHVPLVEENVCEGIKNNVFGTLSVANAAIKNKVSNLVLISSDKAVRPTNIMGASKRLAELSMQALHSNINSDETVFSIVRFGNVLESSGSVIPKFKKQIKDGGPVTLTHPDVTRYFMTLTEAAQLVIQAGAMSNKCEVYILDMGESIKIKDLITKMIKLSGLVIKEGNNDGDIEIKVIGLRPGEKLYEELLTGNNPQKTSHIKIFKSQESFIPFDDLKLDLDNLFKLIKENRTLEVKQVLEKLVPTFKTSSKIVDHIYNSKINL